MLFHFLIFKPWLGNHLCLDFGFLISNWKSVGDKIYWPWQNWSCIDSNCLHVRLLSLNLTWEMGKTEVEFKAFNQTRFLNLICISQKSQTVVVIYSFSIASSWTWICKWIWLDNTEAPSYQNRFVCLYECSGESAYVRICPCALW